MHHHQHQHTHVHQHTTPLLPPTAATTLFPPPIVRNIVPHICVRITCIIYYHIHALYLLVQGHPEIGRC